MLTKNGPQTQNALLWLKYLYVVHKNEGEEILGKQPATRVDWSMDKVCVAVAEDLA